MVKFNTTAKKTLCGSEQKIIVYHKLTLSKQKQKIIAPVRVSVILVSNFLRVIKI